MGADDPTQPKTCNFASHTKSYEAEEVQKTLRMMGATGIKADGLWGACSESAYAKVFGEPLTKESLLKIFEINCAKLNKVFAGSKTCSDGSDAVDPNYTKAPPPSGGGGSSSLLSKIAASVATPKLQVTKRASAASMIKNPTYVPKTTVDNALSVGEQTIIPGVPNLYVTIGGLALLGVAGWFAYGAMTKGGGKVKRNAGKKVRRSSSRAKAVAKFRRFVATHMGHGNKPTKAAYVRAVKDAQASGATDEDLFKAVWAQHDRVVAKARTKLAKTHIWWVVGRKGGKIVRRAGPQTRKMSQTYVKTARQQPHNAFITFRVEKHDNW